MRRIAGVIAVAIGCGRVGFDLRVASDGPADAGANIALVQVQAPGYGSAAMVTVPIAEHAGDLIVAAAYWDDNPDTILLTDTAGLAWTSLPAQVATTGCGGPTGNATGAQLSFAIAAADANDEVTLAQSAGTHPLGLFVLEYSGIAASSLDTSAQLVAPSASNAMFAPTLATTAVDVVVGFFVDTINTGSDGGGAGFAVEARDTGFPSVLEDAIVPAGSHMPTATLPTGQTDACWIAIAAAFRAR